MRSKPLEVLQKGPPRSRPIEAMNDATKNVARLVEFLFQVRLTWSGRGTSPVLSPDKISRTLINGNQVIVFVNDI